MKKETSILLFLLIGIFLIFFLPKVPAPAICNYDLHPNSGCPSGFFCNGGICSSGCSTPADCDDGNICTFDECDTTDGQCLSTPIPDCCIGSISGCTPNACEVASSCSLDNKCVYTSTCDSTATCADSGECICSDGQISSTKCTGTYYTSVGSCYGTVAGSIPSIYEGENCSTSFFTEESCSQGWLTHGCTWISSTEANDCSVLSTASCGDYSGCSTKVVCVDKAQNCADCDGSNECISGNCLFGECVPADSSCLFNLAPCGMKTGESFCDAENNNKLTCTNDGTWTSTTCDYGCTNGACAQQGVCDECDTDSDCEEGLHCITGPDDQTSLCVGNDNGDDYCVRLNVASQSLCEATPFQYHCIDNSNLAYCDAGNWEIPTINCEFGCSNGACNSDPNPAQTLSWMDEQRYAQYITTQGNTVPMAKNDVISLVVANPASVNGEFLIKSNNEIIYSNLETSGDSSTTYSSLTLSDDFLISAEQGKISSDIYNITFTYDGIDSEPLYIEYGESLCGDDICQEDETASNCYIDCHCGDGICNESIETPENCHADCFVAPGTFWADDVVNPLHINWSDVYDRNYQIKMFYGPSTDTDLTFSLYEDDSPLGSDDIRLNQPATQSNGNLVYIWNLTPADFEAAGSEQSWEFKFKINEDTSELLEIQFDDEAPTCEDRISNGDEDGIDCGGDCIPCDCIGKTLCSDYGNDSARCGSDDCGLYENSVASGDISCGIGLDGNCTTVSKIVVGDREVGTCYYDEDEENDTCLDGFLSYSYNTTWNWKPANNYLKIPDGQLASDYIPDAAGFHYDPKRASLACSPGKATIPCPAQVKLSFLTWKNVVSSILLIIIIYLIIELKKKKTLPKKKAKVVTKNATNKKTLPKKKAKVVTKKLTKKKTPPKKKLTKKKISKKAKK